MKKLFSVKRRNFLFSVLALSTFPKLALSSQSSLKHMMRPQLLGSDDAPIKIKEYFSLTCGHCANFHKNTLPRLKEKYIDKGKIQLEFVDYPLDRLAVIAAALASATCTLCCVGWCKMNACYFYKRFKGGRQEGEMYCNPAYHSSALWIKIKSREYFSDCRFSNAWCNCIPIPDTRSNLIVITVWAYYICKSFVYIFVKCDL